MPDLVICVVHHSNEKLLEDLIKSIERSIKKFSYEIAIVDNNTKTNFLEYLKEKYNNIQTNYSDIVSGYAFNQNIILKKNYTKYKYSLVINDDTFFKDEYSLQNLYDFMCLNQKVAASSPQILNKDLSAQPVYGPIGTYLSHTMRLMMISKIVNKNIIKYINEKKIGVFFPKFINSYFKSHIIDNKDIPVTKISGCCVIINNKFLDKIGFFDDLNFDMYCDDTDWSLRANNLNYLLYKVSNSKLIHYGGESIYPGMVGRKEITILKYLKKHFPNFIYIRIYLFILFIHSIVMALTNLVKSAKGKDYFLFFKEYLILATKTIYYFVFNIKVK